jgi:hypothetical protein
MSRTYGVLDGTNPNPFTPGTFYPDCAIASGMAVIVNGKENAKVVGQKVYDFGFETPDAPSVTDSAVAGNPNGDYEFALLYSNETTGNQSSLGDIASISVTDTKIDISWVTPPDAQVTHVKLCVRKATLGPDFFIVTEDIITIVEQPDNELGYPITVTSVQFDATDTELLDMVLVAPDTVENTKAPVLTAIEAHKYRLFGVVAADRQKLVYSKLDEVEAFHPDNYEYVGKGDGDPIIALQSRREGLLILKLRSIWLLEGDSPADWSLVRISEGVGCVSVRAIQTFNNVSYWWCPAQGPIRWAGEGAVEPLANPALLPTVQDVLATTDTSPANVVIDTFQQHVLFVIPGALQTKNTMILPYLITNSSWMSEFWDPFDISAAATIPVTGGPDMVYLGGYYGDIFRWWEGENDGIGTGLRSGGVPLAGGTTGDTSVTLTTGAYPLPVRLNGRVLILQNADHSVTLRFVIASNTNTTVTFERPDSLSYDIDNTWTWTLGGPNFLWDTKDLVHGELFVRKRYTFVDVFFESIEGTPTLFVETLLNHNINPPETRRYESIVNDPGAVWDTAIFDSDEWGPKQRPLRRFRVGKVGNALRVRITNHEPDVAFAIRAVQSDATLLDEKGVTPDAS